MVPDDFPSRVQAALGDTYVVERELGGGGMSRVFVAREVALDREVVLKVLSPELGSTVDRDRFRREVHFAAQLQHPHIVPLLSAGESGGLLWYTMPRISGDSLREVLQRRKTLPADEVLQLLADVADALGYAHQRGLAHRDIKPENILVQGSHALVTDFGVAKAISAALPGSGATAVGVAIGTPAYMAPEQVAGDPAADHRIDIYALGLLAYELLTGETPFRGTSPHQTMAAHLIRQVTPPDALRADLPPGLSAVVMRCLQKDPDDRYQEADALRQDLRRVAGGSGDHVARTPAGPRVRKALSHQARYAILGTALVATLALAVFLAMQRVTVVVGPAPSTAAGFPAANGAALLTLADSIAIAEAVERRLADQEGANGITRATLDSLRREITTAVSDSIRRSAPAPSDRWAVVPTPPRSPVTREMDTRRSAAAVGSQRPELNNLQALDSVRAGLMLLSRNDPRLAAATDGEHARLLDSLGAVFDRLPGLHRVAMGQVDSLMRSGVALERVMQESDSRFLVSVIPNRRRDSLSYTIMIQDRESSVRPLRTIRTPFTALSQAGGALTDEVAAQVRQTIEEMRRAPTAPAGRPRPRG